MSLTRPTIDLVSSGLGQQAPARGRVSAMGRRPADGSAPALFDDTTLETLGAVVEQIASADVAPRADHLRSPDLVETITLGDPCTMRLLKAGLAALDASSELLFELRFVDLPFHWQTHLLRIVEAGEAPHAAWRDVPGRSIEADSCEDLDQGGAAQRVFFATLRSLCERAERRPEARPARRVAGGGRGDALNRSPRRLAVAISCGGGAVRLRDSETNPQEMVP